MELADVMGIVSDFFTNIGAGFSSIRKLSVQVEPKK
jgi:hypothetical protein